MSSFVRGAFAMSRLVLTTGRELVKDELVSISINASWGIRLPVNGVRPDQTHITIETSSSARPVLPTPLEYVQAVGSFLTYPASGRVASKLSPVEVVLDEGASDSADLYQGSMLTVYYDGLDDPSSSETREIVSYSKDRTAVVISPFTAVRLVDERQESSIAMMLGVYQLSFSTANQTVYSHSSGRYFMFLVTTAVQCSGTGRAWVVGVAPEGNIEVGSLFVCDLSDPPNLSGLLSSSWNVWNGTGAPVLAGTSLVDAFADMAVYTISTPPNPTLTYNIPRNRESVSITLSIFAHMDMQPGDLLTLQLPGFAYCKRRCRPTSTLSQGLFETTFQFTSRNAVASAGDSSVCFPTGASTLSTWYGGTETSAPRLEIPIIDEIERLQVVEITIFTTNTSGRAVWIPDFILPDPIGMELSASASLGSIAVMPLLLHPARGFFRSRPQLNFEPPIAGAATTLRVSFSVLEPLVTATVLELVLPGFTLRNAIVFNATSLGYDIESSIAEGSALTLMIRLAVSDNLEFEVVLPASEHVHLPERGITGALDDIYLVAQGSGALCLTQLVGSFRRTPTLNAEPRLASSPVSISVNFVPNMDLVQYEQVSLTLPLFEGEAVELVQVLGGSHGSKFTGRWMPGNSTFYFTLNCGEKIVAGESVTLVIGIEVGIISPPTGIRLGGNGIAMGTNAVAGPILDTQMQVQPIGVLAATRLNYGTREAGATTDIQFSFTPSINLIVGDTITLYLPGFTGNDEDRIFFSEACNPGIFKDCKGIVMQGSWTSSTTALVMTVRRAIPFETLVRVEVGEDYGLALPTGGLAQNDPSLQVEGSIFEGFAGRRSISTSPAIGAISVSISFDPPRAGEV
eukprot:3728390-Rhodomonas_salina.1